jgi:hypothetical protein
MGLGAFVAVDGRASPLVAIRNPTEFCRNIDRWRDDFISAVGDDTSAGRPCESTNELKSAFRAGVLGAINEYAAEFAEVGRMMRDGAFRARAAVSGQTDIGAIPSTIIQRVSCRSRNVKSQR